MDENFNSFCDTISKTAQNDIEQSSANKKGLDSDMDNRQKKTLIQTIHIIHLFRIFKNSE